jgi:hypothetical protein
MRRFEYSDVTSASKTKTMLDISLSKWEKIHAPWKRNTKVKRFIQHQCKNVANGIELVTVQAVKKRNVFSKESSYTHTRTIHMYTRIYWEQNTGKTKQRQAVTITIEPKNHNSYSTCSNVAEKNKMMNKNLSCILSNQSSSSSSLKLR